MPAPTSKYIRVSGVLYRRADTPVIEGDALLREWKASREYNDFIIREVAPAYLRRRDLEGLGERLRDKFSMWVSENLLAPVEESIIWLDEAHELARRSK